MNTTVSDSPQVLSRKGDPVTGETYSGEENPNDRNADIESLEQSIKIAQQQGRFDLVYELMGKIKNLKQQVKENVSSNKFSFINYNEQQINDEIGEITNTPEDIYPKEIKSQIIKILKDIPHRPLKLTKVDMKTVDNTESGEEGISLDKMKQYTVGDKEYFSSFQKILSSNSFPPPIVVEYNGQKRLIGGNRRAVALAINNKTNVIPCIFIRLQSNRLVKESILPDIAAGLGRTGVPFSTTYDPSGDCGSQPQGIAKQELNDPEEDAKDTKTKIDLLTKKLEVAKMRKDWGEVFNLMNQLEGLRGL